MPPISIAFILFTGILSRIKHSAFPLPEEEIILVKKKKRIKEVYGAFAHQFLPSAIALKRICQ